MQGGRGEAGWGNANFDDYDAFEDDAVEFADNLEESDLAVHVDDDDDGVPVLGVALVALSGAVVGFFIAGHFATGAIVFVAVLVGVVLGWMARGVAS